MNKDDGLVEHIEPNTPEQVAAFWTAERMASAAPVPMPTKPWSAVVEEAYRLGIRDAQEGIDHCFNPYTDEKGNSIDINNDRKDAWHKGWMEIHNETHR